MWDAVQYGRYGDERSRPFFELLARVGAEKPGYVADLGCGPGNLTVRLAERWPGAEVVGVDSSPQMIEAALSAQPSAGVSFALGDVRDWRPARPPDVLVSNAVLQWVPGHRDLVVRWAGQLAAGGWLAFQLPGNFGQPSQAILRELAAAPRWRPLLREAELNRQSDSPEGYAELLGRPGFEVDAWETTYVHVLHGADPVVEWVKGTALRPVLAVLDDERAAAFLADYGERVRAAYPPRPFGTLFPFRRVFTVVHRIG
ncbi:MAG: trans-aconitate 2-methyltransferase [Streptosporangiaceae bacterium]|nr:trans-aconitate 2-methyltransferase [Streptosporangiaceae bacterium]MBV9858276.1 trans-aconitate 2-methyltransferase [Streptosporangiaceae bacterium]